MYGVHFNFTMIQFYGSYGSNLTINLQFYNFTKFNKIEWWQYIQLQLQFYNFTIQLQFYKYFTYNSIKIIITILEFYIQLE